MHYDNDIGGLNCPEGREEGRTEGMKQASKEGRNEVLKY